MHYGYNCSYSYTYKLYYVCCSYINVSSAIWAVHVCMCAAVTHCLLSRLGIAACDAVKSVHGACVRARRVACVRARRVLTGRT